MKLDPNEGFMVERNRTAFQFVEDTVPKIKWLRGIGNRKDYYYPLNYYLLGFRQKMLHTSDYLFNQYLKPYSEKKELIYYHLWNGTEQTSCHWHNDFCEGANIMFLLYFTDMDKTSGGEIMFRNTEQNNRITCFHLPQKYDVLIGSQDEKFEHRVEHFRDPSVQRITMNFGFKVDNSPWT